MNYIIVIILCAVSTIGAMDNDTQNNNNDTRIQLQKSIKNKNFNTVTNILDKQLQDMEFLPLNEDNSHLVAQELSHASFFRGKDKSDIDRYIHLMKDKNPVVYGQITQMLIDKKSNKNRLNVVELDDLSTVDQKIQHGLLQIAIDNQELAIQNRKEDLAQAKKDRGAVNCRFIISLCASVPATVLSVISIVKIFS